MSALFWKISTNLENIWCLGNLGILSFLHQIWWTLPITSKCNILKTGLGIPNPSAVVEYFVVSKTAQMQVYKAWLEPPNALLHYFLFSLKIFATELRLQVLSSFDIFNTIYLISCLLSYFILSFEDLQALLGRNWTVIQTNTFSLEKWFFGFFLKKPM